MRKVISRHEQVMSYCMKKINEATRVFIEMQLKNQGKSARGRLFTLDEKVVSHVAKTRSPSIESCVGYGLQCHPEELLCGLL